MAKVQNLGHNPPEAMCLFLYLEGKKNWSTQDHWTPIEDPSVHSRHPFRKMAWQRSCQVTSYMNRHHFILLHPSSSHSSHSSNSSHSYSVPISTWNLPGSAPAGALKSTKVRLWTITRWDAGNAHLLVMCLAAMIRRSWEIRSLNAAGWAYESI